MLCVTCVTKKTKQQNHQSSGTCSQKLKFSQTPNSYATSVNDLIDNATISKTEDPTNQNLHKSAESLDRFRDDCVLTTIKEALTIWSTDNPTDKLSWWRWEHHRTEINEKDVGRLTNVEHRCSIGEVVAEVVRQLLPYGYHATNFLCQLAALKKTLNFEKRDKLSSLGTLPETSHAKGSLTHKQHITPVIR